MGEGSSSEQPSAANRQELETIQLRLNEANAFATEAARTIDNLHERLQRTMAERDRLRGALVELEAAMPSSYDGIWRRTIRDALAGGDAPLGVDPYEWRESDA